MGKSKHSDQIKLTMGGSYMKDQEKSRQELIAELEHLRLENSRLNARLLQGETHKKTLLLVDDNEDTRAAVAAMLKIFNYTIIEAGSPRQAVNIVMEQKNTIDLILSDIVMPDGGGPDMVDQILKIDPTIKVIFMSGYAEDEVVHDDVFKIQRSCASFIKKPFSLEEIGSLLRQALDR